MTAPTTLLPTQSCLIMNQNLVALRQFLSYSDKRERNSKILNVDSVEFQYSDYGLWVKTQIISQHDTSISSDPKINSSQQNNTINIKSNIQQSDSVSTDVLKLKEQQVKALSKRIEQLQQSITNLQTYKSDSLKINNDLSQKVQYLNTILTRVIAIKQIPKQKLSQIFNDGVQEIQVQYSFDVSIQTPELQETAIIKQLQKQIISQKQDAQLSSKNDNQMIIQQEIVLTDIEIQTTLTMKQMQHIIEIETNNPQSNKNIDKPQKKSKVTQMNSQQRRNFHKRDMLQSQARKKKQAKQHKIKQQHKTKPTQKIVQKIVQIQKIIEVEKIVQKIIQKKIEVPVDRIVEVLRQKIVQIPVQKIVQKTVQKIIQVPPIEIIKQVPVQKIVQKIVTIQKIIQIPVKEIVQVQKIINVPFEVIKQVQKQIVIEIIKQVEVPVEKIVEIQKIKQVQVIKQVKVEIQKIKQVEKIVEIEKQVPQPYPVQTLVIVESEIQRFIEVPIQIPQPSPVKFVDLEESQSKEAILSNLEIVQLQDQLQDLNSKYLEITDSNANYQLQVLYCQKQIDKLSNSLKNSQQALQQSKREYRDLATQCDSQIHQYTTLKDRLQNQIIIVKQNKIKAEEALIVQQQKRNLESLSHQKDMQSLIEQLNELKQYTDSLKFEINESQQRVSHMSQQKSNTQYELSVLKQNYSKLQQDYASLEKDTEGLYTQFKQRQDQVQSLLQKQSNEQHVDKSVYEQHMRNIIQKYQQLEDNNKQLSQKLQQYMQNYENSQNALIEVAQERDLLFDKLTQIQQRFPGDKDSQNENQLLEALESARKQIVELKNQVSKLQSFQKHSYSINHQNQIVSIKNKIKDDPNNKALISQLFDVSDRCVYDIKKLSNHCQQLRKLVVQYELRLQSGPSQDEQQLKVLLEKVVDQLQKQRYDKEAIEQNMEKTIGTLLDYEQALIEKDQQINYLRMMLAGRQKQRYMMQYSKSNDNLLRRDYSRRQYSRRQYPSRQYIRDDFSYLEKDRINMSAYNRRKIINNEQVRDSFGDKISNSQKSQSNIKKQSQVSNRSQIVSHKEIDLKSLMQAGYMSKLSMLTIMQKIAQKIQQDIRNGPIYLTAQSITVKNFKQLTPEQIQIYCQNTNNPNSLYSSPQILTGGQFNESSLVWNLAIIFDELMHKKLFYTSFSDITSSQDNYKFKSIAMSELKKTITKALLKTPQQRISLSNLVFSLSLQIRKIRG